MQGRFQSHSAAETEALGGRLASELGIGDVVLVEGELGAGKTTFVRGACRALGVTGPVTSPTFTIGHRYRADGRATVAHVDLYRLSGFDDEDPGLLEPYFGPGTISFVEWPERGDPGVRPATHRVRLEHGGGDTRRIMMA